MARVEIMVGRSALAREVEKLMQRVQASDAIRAQVATLVMQGIRMSEAVTTPARRGRLQLRVQLSDPYWQLLEQEAV